MVEIGPSSRESPTPALRTSALSAAIANICELTLGAPVAETGTSGNLAFVPREQRGDCLRVRLPISCQVEQLLHQADGTRSHDDQELGGLGNWVVEAVGSTACGEGYGAS